MRSLLCCEGRKEAEHAGDARWINANDDTLYMSFVNMPHTCLLSDVQPSCAAFHFCSARNEVLSSNWLTSLINYFRNGQKPKKSADNTAKNSILARIHQPMLDLISVAKNFAHHWTRFSPKFEFSMRRLPVLPRCLSNRSICTPRKT